MSTQLRAPARARSPRDPASPRAPRNSTTMPAPSDSRPRRLRPADRLRRRAARRSRATSTRSVARRRPRAEPAAQVALRGPRSARGRAARVGVAAAPARRARAALAGGKHRRGRRGHRGNLRRGPRPPRGLRPARLLSSPADRRRSAPPWLSPPERLRPALELAFDRRGSGRAAHPAPPAGRRPPRVGPGDGPVECRTRRDRARPARLRRLSASRRPRCADAGRACRCSRDVRRAALAGQAPCGRQFARRMGGARTGLGGNGALGDRDRAGGTMAAAADAQAWAGPQGGTRRAPGGIGARPRSIGATPGSGRHDGPSRARAARRGRAPCPRPTPRRPASTRSTTRCGRAASRAGAHACTGDARLARAGSAGFPAGPSPGDGAQCGADRMRARPMWDDPEAVAKVLLAGSSR